jgi:predicted transcriptional regulator
VALSFKALKVWRALKRKPGSLRSEIAQELGWMPDSVTQFLRRLERDGCAKRKGNTHHCRWSATERRPSDNRGTSPGSLKALVVHRPEWMIQLSAAKKARAKPKRAYKFKPATELERCWPVLHVVREIGQEAGDD